MKPLEDAERRLAEAAARLIAQAGEIGLANAATPDKLVPPHAIQLLARAYVELLDHRADLHDRIEQIARVAIEGAIWEIARQQNGFATGAGAIIDGARTEGVQRAQPFIEALLRSAPASEPARAPSGPRLVLAANEVAALSDADLLATYCRVMRETEGIFVKYESYVVRQWDGMDGCWTDCTGAVGRDEALRAWAKMTDGGTHHVAYAEIDYYRIFPGDTHMVWDGAEGQEMHR